MKNSFDILIIGGGPAGVSAAIYAKRAGASVCIFDDDGSRLNEAKSIENYYGTGVVSGRELKDKGLEEAERLGIIVEQKSVDSLEKDFETNSFVLASGKDKYFSRVVILASGLDVVRPDKRLEKYKNKNISSCATCDGFFYRNKRVAVLGSESYALSEARALSPLAKKVYIIAEERCDLKDEKNIEIVNEKVSEFLGEDQIMGARLASGKEIGFDGLFLAKGKLGANALSKKLGLNMNRNFVETDEKMQTSLQGLFAAGDITGGVLQVAKAVYEGMLAGLSAAEFVKNL